MGNCCAKQSTLLVAAEDNPSPPECTVQSDSSSVNSTNANPLLPGNQVIVSTNSNNAFLATEMSETDSRTNEVDKEKEITKQVDVFRGEDGSLHVNQYQILEELGQGSYGVVSLAMDTAFIIGGQTPGKENEQYVAIKAIPRNKFDTNYRESDIMQSLQHANIISLKEIIDDLSHDYVYLVMEFMPGGPVMTLSAEGEAAEEPLTEAEARNCMIQLVSAVTYLHRQNVFHGDIKPENILCDEERRVVKLGDFGSARLLNKRSDDGIRSFQGTISFMPPEVLEGGTKVNGFACDMWAMGVTLYCFLYGHTPYHGANLVQLYKDSSNPIEFPPEPAVSETVINLMKRMLNRDILSRITLSELKDHPWMTSQSGPCLVRPIRSWRSVAKKGRKSSPRGSMVSWTRDKENNLLGGNTNEPQRILIVEDVSTQRQILQRFFENAIDNGEGEIPRVLIDTVGDGKDAVVSATSKKYDLILMDVHMYVMNGYEATMLIREYESQTTVKASVIVGLSADPHEELARYCGDVGMNDVIPKPIGISQVRDLCAAYGFPVRLSLPSQKPLVASNKETSAYTIAYDAFLQKSDPMLLNQVPPSPSSPNEIDLGDPMACPTPGIARMLMKVERQERKQELKRAPAIGASVVAALAFLCRTFNEEELMTKVNTRGGAMSTMPLEGLRLRHLPEVKLDKLSEVEAKDKEEEILQELEKQEMQHKSINMRKFFETQRRKAARLQGEFLNEITCEIKHRHSIDVVMDDVKQKGVRAMMKARKNYQSTPMFDLNQSVSCNDLFAVSLYLFCQAYYDGLDMCFSNRAKEDVVTLWEAAEAVVKNVCSEDNANSQETALTILKEHVYTSRALKSLRAATEKRKSNLGQSRDVFIVTAAADINKRTTMEDSYFIWFGNPTDEYEMLVAVYDGHGGAEAAVYCRNVLVPHALLTAKTKQVPIDWASAFLDVDSSFNEKAVESDCDAGTTALVVTLTSTKVITANVGDCMAVMYNRTSGPRSLNKQHTTDNEEECLEIEARGGVCLFNNGKRRVNGMLLVTRAIGDRPCRDVLTAHPDVMESPILEGDEFMVIASDGLWNFVSVEDVCELVQEMIKGVDAVRHGIGASQFSDNDLAMFSNSTEHDIAEAIVFEAKERGSSDNITVVLVRLPENK